MDHHSHHFDSCPQLFWHQHPASRKLADESKQHLVRLEWRDVCLEQLSFGPVHISLEQRRADSLERIYAGSTEHKSESVSADIE